MQREERTRYAVEIPALGSLILTHSLDKQVPALKEFPKDERPYSPLVFWSFRVMVGLGMLMIALGIGALWLRYKQRLYQSRPFLHFALWMGPAGLIAILAGWFTTEVGRQPWVVYRVVAYGRCGFGSRCNADESQPADILRGLQRRFRCRLQLYGAVDLQRPASLA